MKRERLACGLSQAQLASKVGVAQQQVSQWALNKVEPTLSNIIAIVRVLGISFDDLIYNIK